MVICIAVSVGIELLQEWTGLGMADWKDLVSNALGGAVGVLIVKVSGRQSVTHEPRGGSGL